MRDILSIWRRKPLKQRIAGGMLAEYLEINENTFTIDEFIHFQDTWKFKKGLVFDTANSIIQRKLIHLWLT